MSGVRNRLARAIDGDSATTDELIQRLAALESAVRADLDRQEELVRTVTVDLTERLAALERRLAALEARDH